MDTNTETVLAAGSEFFDDLINEINRATKNIYIRSFLWRNDLTGIKVAETLLNAADRGVCVHITKDRIGAFFEYAEGNGQSFFHDNPSGDPLFSNHSTKTVAYQARAMAKLYGRTPRAPQRNDLLHKFRSHKNIHVIDSFKLYDHSKVIVIDECLSYVGGIGFGDEFNSGQESWIDFMFKLTSKQ